MVLALLAGAAQAQDGPVRLYADPALADTGLLRHILPRFTLKTQVRVELVTDQSAADVVLGGQGRALFEGLGQTWHLAIRGTGDRVDRLATWLRSDVGRNTVQSFAPDGTSLFGPATEVAVVTETGPMSELAKQGHAVALAKCTRCHGVDEATRWSGTGATPSFGVLRTFDDWEGRFAAFYALKPHPSFTQVEDITEPFPVDRPPALVPIDMTLDELDAVLAYVAAMPAADLGEPLVHQ